MSGLLFLSACNLGITIATSICGVLITDIGTKFIFVGGLLLLIGSSALIFIKIRISKQYNIRKVSNISVEALK